MGIGKLGDDDLCGDERDRVAGQDGGSPNRHGEMGFADAGRSEQKQRFPISDKAASHEVLHLRLVDRGLCRKIEACQIANEGEARKPDAHLDPALVLPGDLTFEKERQGFPDRQFYPGCFVDEIVELVADGRQLQPGEHGREVIVDRSARIMQRPDFVETIELGKLVTKADAQLVHEMAMRVDEELVKPAGVAAMAEVDLESLKIEELVDEMESRILARLPTEVRAFN